MASRHPRSRGIVPSFLLLTTIVGLAAGCPTRADDPSFDSLADEYEQWVDFSFPEDALSHGRTPPSDRITQPGLRGAVTRHTEVQEFLDKITAIDRVALSENRRLDYDLLRRELAHSVESFKFKRWMMPVHQRGGPQQDLPEFARMVPLRTDDDWTMYAKRLTRLGAAVRDTQAMMVEAMKEGLVPPKVVLDGVLQQFDAVLGGNLRELEAPMASMPGSISAARQQELRDMVRESVLDALLALGEMRNFLASEYIPRGLDSISVSDQPMGAAYYEFQLRHFTTTNLTAKEIHAIGTSEVARIHSEMLAVIRTSDWYLQDSERSTLSDDALFASFIAYLRTDPRFYHTSAQALLAGYRNICKRIDAQLPEYFGILPRQPYGVREIPRFMAPSQTTAYYQFGSMKAGFPGWFYANTYALDQRPTYEMIPLSLHEAVPGHHLQIALADEAQGIRQFRRSVDSTAFVEGWALYAERLGIPMGLYEDPYDNFGRLLYEMWRACRLVVDPGMHALGMTRAQAIAFMESNTALSKLNIEREIDRYIAWPGQATAYKIGELEIRRIRGVCEDRLGAQFDLRAFHDHLLMAGPLPLDILAARMDAWCSQQLTRSP
ncbi:MAG: DUF885 domain-containing protein [Phycisphaerales bacterium]|nr:DUF885 domain-containing protein [Phycisphaerales bacterium]